MVTWGCAWRVTASAAGPFLPAVLQTLLLFSHLSSPLPSLFAGFLLIPRGFSVKKSAMGRILQEMELQGAAGLPSLQCALRGAARAGLVSGSVQDEAVSLLACDVSSSLLQRIALKRGVK